MKDYTIKLLIICILIFCGLCIIFDCGKSVTNRESHINRLPHIYPDYSGIVIPPNIAPLNFRIMENGRSFKVKISSDNQSPLIFHSEDPDLLIPLNSWKKLLKESKGDTIKIEVDVLTINNIWYRFTPIKNYVMNDSIDRYIVYRRMMSYHNFWGPMGLYQRNLEDFTEKPILLNRTLNNACINCHTFYQKQSDRMILHTRGKIGSGMLIIKGDHAVKVDTRTAFNKGPVAYRSWHPDGNILAASANQLIQFFHATGESREVSDLNSDLLLYHFDSNMISTHPAIANPERMETFPCWSRDGRFLFFCSSAKIQSYLTPEDKDISKIYDKIKYDLNKVSYDPVNNTWGKVMTVLSAAETGKSIVMPCISPDGRFLLFCMADYGSFPVFLKSSDIYILDLQTGEYYKPDINSDQSESNFNWTSNSRWIVFGSKRLDGICTRLYLCFIDGKGRISKPFILPQKDPEFYNKILDTFNIPEFITTPVTISWQTLTRAALDNKSMIKAVLDEKVKLDGISGATMQSMWQQAK